MKRWKVVAAFLAVAAAGGVSAAFAFAGAAADAGQIDGCVAPNGVLRVVGASGGCKGNETSVAWNIQGIQGPAGPAGPQGPAGPPGTVLLPPIPRSHVVASIAFSDAGFPGPYDVLSWHHGTGAGGGGGASQLSFTKRVDEATPHLLAAAASGTVIDSAVLTFGQGGHTVTLTMRGVTVGSVEIGDDGSGDVNALENVELTFRSLLVEYS